MRSGDKRLLDPPKAYRPVPFWSWNEKLDASETRAQIDRMDKAGIGGYFMHARGGLQTEYMGAEWMDNVRAGIEEGAKRGMGAWGYDENGWPSGFGGGAVNGLGEAYQQKYLRYEPYTRDGERTVALCEANGQTWRLYYDVNPFYVDVLDPEVTKRFLESVHERYRERLGADFSRMAGFFTDEPQISRNGIPWSQTLPESYEARYKEALAPRLIDLFLNTPSSARTRWRYWALVCERFTSCFMKQIFDWCEAHGDRLTGHMVLEEDLLCQLTCNGAVMPNYEYFHIPGMDWLGRRIDPPATPLQVASVAHQLGKKQVLSETFALCGWNVSFEDFKWILEWQMVRGVTLLCEHLEGYSLRGIRKRDYPASIFCHQPWWGEFKRFTDYASRVGMLLSEGEARMSTLLIHPIDSAWVLYDDGKNEGLDALNREFEMTIHALERAHVPFHLGDERILRGHGRVEGRKLVVGEQRYENVLVPKCLTICENTLLLLRDFVMAGGRLVFLDDAPALVEGVPDTRATQLAKGRIDKRFDFISLLGEFDARVEAAEGDAGDVTVTQRIMDDARMYYFVNSRRRACAASIYVRGESAKRFDPETGEVTDIPYRRAGDWLRVDFRFEPTMSLVLFVYDEETESVATTAPVLSPIDARGTWAVERMSENALTLDACDVYFDGRLYREKMPINSVQEVACALGRAVDMRLVYHVRVETAPADPCYLVTETPEKYAVTVNGAPADMADRGMYLDRAFRKIDISGLLRPGENEIALTTTFRQSHEVYQNLANSLRFESEKNKLTYDDEIEACYLVGHFGVKTPPMEALERRGLRCAADFTLVAEPKTLTDGEFQSQGLPFFAGSVTMKKRVFLRADELENRCLRFDRLPTTVTAIRVNGKDAGALLWRPYDVPLTGLLREGENEIELTETNNLRNLLGPHHLAIGESHIVAPGCFFEESPVWAPDRKKGDGSWRDDYCFIEFGLFF